MRNAGHERMMVMHFLMGSNSDRYRTTIEDFKHAYLGDKKNTYPKTLMHTP